MSFYRLLLKLLGHQNLGTADSFNFCVEKKMHLSSSKNLILEFLRAIPNGVIALPKEINTVNFELYACYLFLKLLKVNFFCILVINVHIKYVPKY